MRSINKSVIITIIAVLIAIVAVLFAGGFYFINYSLKSNKSDIGRHPEEVKELLCTRYTPVSYWLDSLERYDAIKDTFIIGRDNMKLKGYYIAADSATTHTALLIHGYRDSHWCMFAIGYLYQHQLGFNIIMPDLYGHGESEGESIGMGWLDRRDMFKWIDMAKSLYGNDMEMVIHGVSMGGATTMMISGEPDVPSNVKCFVEDCGYTDVFDEFAHELKQEYKLPRFPLMQISSLICKNRYCWTFREASALEQVKKCQRPMLFIHGGDDDFVPTNMVFTLYEAHQGEKDMWIAHQSKHAESYHDYPDEYTIRVSNFISNYIKTDTVIATDSVY